MDTIGCNPVWYIGTMGFSYRDWVSVFYPQGLKPKEFLSYYSRIFHGVEIDSTFYGTPSRSTIIRWKNSVREDFKFCLKTPRLITHNSGLMNTRSLMINFVDTAKELGGNLGVILLQFPPSFTDAQYELLARFLGELPSTVRYAIEIRHPSWYRDGGEQLADLLKPHNICWASTVFPDLPERIIPTSDLFYIRWIGKHGRFQQHNLERIDRNAQMKNWYKMILSQASSIMEVYGHFNNDYAGYAAGTAIKFLQIAGLPAEMPHEPIQGTLF